MREKNLTRYDTVIAGGGPAGLSAALWCDELGLSSLVIEGADEFGGQLLSTYNEIRNHLGVSAANGRELRDTFMSQLASRNFDAALSSRIGSIDFDRRVVAIDGRDDVFFESLIVATGVRRRTLGVAGEDRYAGRGIIDSGKKNAGAVAGKNVVIVGGGDAALENALILGATAASVTLVHRRDTFRARDEFIGPAKANPRVEMLLNRRVIALGGEEKLETVEVFDENTGERSILRTDFLLVRIGVAPNNEILGGRAELDDRGYVIVDRDGETSLKNVFAAGDVANPESPTVSTAVGMGATAAKSIFARLRC